MILWERKIVIVHPPRCGGSSVEHALDPEYWRNNPWEKHRNTKELFDIINWRSEDPKKFTWIGLIRHPLDRAKSMLGKGYWNNGVLFPGQKAKVNSLLFQLQFASLVRPTAHEGKNLKLIHFYDYSHGLDEVISVTYYDIHQLKELATRLEIENLPHIQKTKSPVKRIHFLFNCLVFARFRADYKKFNYKSSKVQYLLLPLSFLVIVTFQLLHRISWCLKHILFKA